MISMKIIIITKPKTVFLKGWWANLQSPWLISTSWFYDLYLTQSYLDLKIINHFRCNHVNWRFSSLFFSSPNVRYICSTGTSTCTGYAILAALDKSLRRSRVLSSATCNLPCSTFFGFTFFQVSSLTFVFVLTLALYFWSFYDISNRLTIQALFVYFFRIQHILPINKKGSNRSTVI
jgi:hypothetical protein